MVGADLQKARIRKQLTQRRLGLLLGYTEGSAERVVQLWEHDKQPIPIKHWKKLAVILDVPLEWFLPE